MSPFSLYESTPSQGDRFKNAGMELDAAIGLYYDRARYLDPAAGRFIALDPIGFQGEDANLYRYVGNDATDLIDPSGKIFFVPVVIAIGFVAIGGLLLGPSTAYAPDITDKTPKVGDPPRSIPIWEHEPPPRHDLGSRLRVESELQKFSVSTIVSGS